MPENNIHSNQPILRLGADLSSARGAMILLHGRGDSAVGISQLTKHFGMADIAYLIPQAGQNRWYPNSAFTPLEANEPDLSNALNLIENLLKEIFSAGLPSEKIVIGGFSQGACLALEFAARNADTYGGVFAYTGALIGSADTERNYQKNLTNVPVFLGTSDNDPWVQTSYQKESVRILEELGAKVNFKIYPGLGHTINEDEISIVKEMLSSL